VREIAGEHPQEPKRVFGIAADLSTAEGANKAIEEVHKIGALDVLVNNMGIFEPKPFEQISDEEWLRFFTVNVLSGIRLCRVFFPEMLARNSGNILFISSECGFSPVEFMPHYSMTKTAQLSIGRSLAQLAKGTKVRVNTVLPGPTWTEGVEEYINKLASERKESIEVTTKNYFKEVEPNSLIQRFITADEVADSVLFLSSPAASAITGSSLRVEGGCIKML